MIDKLKEENGVLLQGHIKITNPETGEIREPRQGTDQKICTMAKKN